MPTRVTLLYMEQRCPCEQRLPWHLFALGLQAHTCSCARTWAASRQEGRIQLRLTSRGELTARKPSGASEASRSRTATRVFAHVIRTLESLPEGMGAEAARDAWNTACVDADRPDLTITDAEATAVVGGGFVLGLAD